MRGDEHRWEGPGAAEALAPDLVYDAASRMFWRNVRARVSSSTAGAALAWPAVPVACLLPKGLRAAADSRYRRVSGVCDTQPRPCHLLPPLLHLQAATQSQASSAHAFRRFARRECLASSHDTCVILSLHVPLTLPRQPPGEAPLAERPATADTTGRRSRHAGGSTPEAERGQPAAADSCAAAGQGAAGGSDQGVVKAEPQQLVAAAPTTLPAAPRPQAASMDIYADLGVASQGPAGGAAGRASTAVPPVREQRPPTHAPGGADAAGRPASGQHEATAAAGGVQALLSNPEALQALLNDPAQLQSLLQKHPTLISVLKSSLGQ